MIHVQLSNIRSLRMVLLQKKQKHRCHFLLCWTWSACTSLTAYFSYCDLCLYQWTSFPDFKNYGNEGKTSWLFSNYSQSSLLSPKLFQHYQCMPSDYHLLKPHPKNHSISNTHHIITLQIHSYCWCLGSVDWQQLVRNLSTMIINYKRGAWPRNVSQWSYFNDS